MINTYSLPSMKGFAAVLILSLSVACNNSRSDAEIDSEIATFISTNRNYADVQVNVDKGVVTLDGTCYGDDCLAEIAGRVSEIDGVKKVDNKLTINVMDLTLRTSVQSIVSKYTGVQADVAAGEIVLRGSISRDLLEPLMTQLKALDARKIDNQLAIKQ